LLAKSIANGMSSLATEPAVYVEMLFFSYGSEWFNSVSLDFSQPIVKRLQVQD